MRVQASKINNSCFFDAFRNLSLDFRIADCYFVVQSTFMGNTTDFQKDLASIRDMMEKSSRFVSLSGLSGIFAGLFALAGTVYAYFLIYYPNSPFGFRFVYVNQSSVLLKLLVAAALVLIASVLSGIYFSRRKAIASGLPVWSAITRRFLFSILVPLVSGAVFIGLMLLKGNLEIVAPACLLFYGLALMNAGNFTYSEIRVLGALEIGLGLISAWIPGYGLIFWGAGFGFLHIAYGALMYSRYESKH